jgi:ankyrin repeat protein
MECKSHVRLDEMMQLAHMVRFLLAQLYTDSLVDKGTLREVRSTLAGLSKGLDPLENAYRGALERIESQPKGHRERAKKVLSWITFAKRSLVTSEICCALAVELGDTKLDRDNIPDVEDLVSFCAGLVVIDSESAIIRLVHRTAQEYFERIGDIWIPTGQLYIATTCLTYLSFEAFESGSCSTFKRLAKRLHRNEFLDYAAVHWGDHARSVQTKVASQACSFLLQERLVSCATQIVRWHDHLHDGQDDIKQTGLHLAARFGLAHITEELLPLLEANGVQALDAITAKDINGQHPLLLAIEQEHFEMTQLLLERGANPNSQGGRKGHGNAIQTASSRGNEQIMGLLLERDVDLDAECKDHCSALWVACNRGDEKIVKLLIDKGASIYGKIQGRPELLFLAAGQGHEQIVKLLLQAGADPRGMGGDYSNALFAASVEGHEKIVRLLLEQSADPNALDTRYNNAPLYAASTRNRARVVQLLLAKGADPNAEGGYYGTSLFAASVAGFGRVVELLLEYGANPNANSTKYDNAPLYAASSRGHKRVVELLLQNGADPNAEGGYYGTALFAASVAGFGRVVELLLEYGADSAELYNSVIVQ